MKKFKLSLPVKVVVAGSRQFLKDNGFTIFCEIDHQHNASQVGMDMPAACTLIFGKPEAGTKLMQQDIRMSFDLPLRIAIIERADESVLIHPAAEDFTERYDMAAQHPVLVAIDALFDKLQSALLQQADVE